MGNDFPRGVESPQRPLDDAHSAALSRAEEHVDAVTARSAGTPVVGLGGSAGSLQSLKAFFDSMPPDSGAAFVVVQHISPAHESLLPELISQRTRMRVLQAVDGVRVEPNSVYIIPPGCQLALRNGILFLVERKANHGLHMPIDFFFRCLAADREERAIAILLSGAGTDGTLGARAIRVAGGIVLAQSPQTALFGDMPRSAVASGLVDYVLPCEKMPEVVLQYLRHPYVGDRKAGKIPEGREEPADVQNILGLILAETGCDFRCYKPPTILRRIGRRMGLLHLPDTTQYLGLLRRDPGEVKQLVRDLLINVSSFFRDTEAFDEVRDKAVVPTIQAKADGTPVRVWVPACSTGEEAYSLAIILMEELEKTGKKCPVQVFATDLDEEALEVARTGFYPENIAEDVGSERLARFFIRKEKGHKVRDSLREALTFATHNVISDPPFSKVDLISCRNLMIYLDADAQAKILGLFNFALKPGGYLFLGRSETLVGQDDLFEVVSKNARICRRLTPARPLFLDSPTMPGRRRVSLPLHSMNGPASSNFADVIRLEILRHFGASAVLVDRRGTILQFHGQSDKFLNLPSPGPAFNLFDLAKDTLSSQLRLGMHKAVEDQKTVVLQDVPLSQVNRAAFARVTIVPVSQTAQTDQIFVVFFEEVSRPATGEAEVIQSPENQDAITRLEDELRATKQDLQSTIQDLQSSNDELLAANEEVTSTNEELESTNEELVSSTEELQSANEELTTVVSQLQEKVELLDQANEALRRSEERFRILVESSPNAVLLVGPDGTVVLANEQAEALFGYTRNELIGLGIEVLVPRSFRKKHPSYRAEFVSRPQHRPMGAGRELFALRKDGTEFAVEIGLTPLAMPEGLVTMATITDITVRTRPYEGRADS